MIVDQIGITLSCLCYSCWNIIGYDRKEDEKHYIVTELGPEYGSDAWLTVIPKDRHHQQLELPKSLVTHDDGN